MKCAIPNNSKATGNPLRPEYQSPQNFVLHRNYVGTSNSTDKVAVGTGTPVTTDLIVIGVPGFHSQRTFMQAKFSCVFYFEC